MLSVEGQLRKMSAKQAKPVEYFLQFKDEKYALDQLIGQRVMMRFLGEIFCVQCGRKTKKSFQQGYCFPCMQKINECGNCILFPERCRVEHEGGCPENDWAHAHCHADQVVYLSNTSGLKVGVTRSTQIPTRWIDQGAMQAIKLFSTQNRYQAGIIEVALKSFVADKTNWRTMLKQDSQNVDMVKAKESLLRQAEQVLKPILDQYKTAIKLLDDEVTDILYPVAEYPTKITSHSFDKAEHVEGELLAVKGQYLIFDTGVLNLRKFSGYRIRVEVL